MLRIHCTECDRTDEYSTRSTAERDGWSDVSMNGVTGPSAAEATGTCPDCSDE